MAIAIRRLERSHDDLIIAGVCSGLANYTGAPSRVWRLAFGLLTLASGMGVVLYVIFWVLMPAEPKPAAVTVGRTERATGPVGRAINTSERFVKYAGKVVMLVGAVVAIVAKVPPIRDQAVEAWHALAGAPRPSPAPLPTHPDTRPSPALLLTHPEPRPTTPTGFESGLRERLIGVVALAGDVEANVMRGGDEQSLYSVYADEALREELASVRDLRAKGITHDQRLIDRTVEFVRSNGTIAQVRVIERWRTVDRSASGVCVVTPDHRAPQTMHLVRRNGEWLVSRIVFDSTAAPQTEPCG